MADPVVADYYLGSVPAAPTALKGVEAPTLLAQLPTYYAASTHVRQILQVEGYEVDWLWYLATEVLPVQTLPNDCPEWVLNIWEYILRLPNRAADWTAAARRASILARIGSVVTEAQVDAFLAAEGRCATSAIAYTYPADYTVDIGTTGLSAGQIAAITAAAHLVIPAHMSFKVNTVTIR